jgi:hypothetical protein
MATFKPLELMEKKYEIDSDNCICYGDHGKLFEIGEGKLAKLAYNCFNGQLCDGRESQFELFNEAKDQKFAIEMGIRYPEIEGIFAVKEKKTGKYFPAIVMKNLEGGLTLDKLEGDEFREALRQRDLELNKARDAGIIIPDSHKNNAMWYNGLTYLLDSAKMIIKREFD